MGEIIAILRAEAEICRGSTVNQGEYAAAFWVAAIILDRLADQLAKRNPPNDPR